MTVDRIFDALASRPRREILAYQLNSIHNISYYCTLMAGMRDAIRADRFLAFRRQFYAQRNQPGAEH